MKKEKNSSVWRYLGKGLLHLIKIPYYIVRGANSVGKYTDKKIEEKKVRKKKKAMIPKYETFEVLHEEKGEYEDWEKKIHDSDSRIGIILGARGTGKTAFGVKFLENANSKYKKKCYALGFKDTEMPPWIRVVKDINELSNDAFVLIDEGGILFNSRESMSNANKLLSELILISRHKNLSILFISQNSSNLDINILRQADFLALKPSSLLQKEFERKIIQKIYEKASEKFEEHKENKGLTHIYAGDFIGFVSNPLPSFWGEEISKGFR